MKSTEEIEALRPDQRTVLETIMLVIYRDVTKKMGKFLGGPRK